jgi:hypothetical protein
MFGAFCSKMGFPGTSETSVGRPRREALEPEDSSSPKVRFLKVHLGKVWSERILPPERRWVLYFVAPFLFVALIFTVLIRTSDPANVAGFQYTSSLVVLSLNPYNNLGPFPPPPNFFFFLLPQFWAYETHWIVYDSAVILKVFAAIATLALGGFVYKIAYRYTFSSSRSKAAFLAILASPFLFFVSFVWVEQDVIPLAFAVSGLYFLIPLTTSERISNRDLALGSGLLVYGIFLYYFPLIVLWSLLVFSRTWKKVASFTVGIAGWTLFFYLAYAFGGFWQFFTNFTGAFQIVNQVPTYSILNVATVGFGGPLTPLITELYFWMLAGCLAVVLILPFVIRFTGGSVLLSVAITMALPFLLTKIYNGDEIVWVVPFVILFLAARIGEKHLRFWLVASQCWLIPQFILVNMWNSAGYGSGSGVFYFTYLQFHNSTAIYTLFPQFYTFSKLLDVATFLSLSGLCVTLIWLSRPHAFARSPKSWHLGVPDARTSEGDGWPKKDVDENGGTGVQSTRAPARAGLLSGIRKVGRSASFYALVALVTFTVIAIVPVSHSSQITYSGTDPFPVNLFGAPQVPNPSLTYSISENGEVLQITNETGASGPVPTNFTRDLSGQSLAASFSMSVPETEKSTFLDPVAELGSTTVFFAGQISLPGGVFTVVPFHEENVTSHSATVPIARGPPIVLSNLSGSSILQYGINLSSFQFDTLGLFFKPSAVSYTQNLLFYAQLPGETEEVFIAEGTLYFAVLMSGQPWSLYPETALNGPLSGPYSWHSVLFGVQPTQLVFYLDGRIVHITPLASNSNMQLNVGAYLPSSPFYHKYAFNGLTSSLIGFPSSQFGYASAISVGRPSGPDETNLSMITNDSGNWSVVYSGQTLTLEGNFGTFTGASDSSLFSFGRFFAASPELNVRLLSLTLGSTGTDNILARVAVLSIGSPVALFVIGLDRSIAGWKRR